MECLGGYTFVVITSVIRSGGMKMREVYIHCHTFRWYEMRDEHGKVREVYISGHDFCHIFRWSENEGRAWNA